MVRNRSLARPLPDERNSGLAQDLAEEIILGCDRFDVNDIWDILYDASLEDLQALERDVRQYIYAKWPPKDAAEHGIWTEEFLASQIEQWIYQYKWRWNASGPATFDASMTLAGLYKRMQPVGSKFSSWDVPLRYKGQPVTIGFKVSEGKDGQWFIDVEINSKTQ